MLARYQDEERGTKDEGRDTNYDLGRWYEELIARRITGTGGDAA